MMRSRILQVALTFGLVVLAGCAPKQAAIRDWRAIWVTRFDYKSEADVQRIIRNCADAGFNQVVFQVRGNANAFYDSKLEPWAVELGGKHPGWDPLAVAVRAARARKVGLHAWVNVMPAWRGTKPPANPEQLYNKRPEWFWYDQHGNRQALSDFYVSLNPCLPEVREYHVDVFEEIVARYDVDGLHLDYIRFP
ncbi:MAG: glycoside hydrolase family 10 protein, partial [Phycisphaerae bacterium]